MASFKKMKNDTEVVGEGNRRPTAKASPPSAKKRGRRFVFTYYPENDTEVFYNERIMKYCEFGVETCPSTGKLHYQGWMATHEVHSELSLCKKFNCFVRKMGGSILDNEIYCGKENNVRKFGKLSQGLRSDLNELRDSIINGQQTAETIAMEDPIIYHQYGRTLHKIEDIVLRKKFRTEMTTCDWYYGNTGLGKSHIALSNFNPDTHYVWKYDNGWQDGYTGQEVVIINEFRGQIPYYELLSLIDKWPYTLRRRNREPVPFLAKHIVITSALSPAEIYNNLSQKDDLSQLMRRITLYEKTSRSHSRIIT